MQHKHPSGNAEPAHLSCANFQLRELVAKVAAWLGSGGAALTEVAASFKAGCAHVADPADARRAVHSQHDVPDLASKDSGGDRLELLEVVVREHAGAFGFHAVEDVDLVAGDLLYRPGVDAVEGCERDLSACIQQEW